DLSGDPLPEGAIARLGTTRSRPGGPLRFSADGKTLLVAGSFANTIYLRHGFNGKALRRIEVKGRPEILDFSPDGKTVALIDRSGGAKEVPGIHLRDITTGKQVGHLATGYGKAVLATMFASDGKTIATATTDPTVVIWDAATGKKLHELPVEGQILNIQFDRQGKTVHAAVFQQGLVVQQWDIANKKKLKALPRFDKEISFVNFSPDGQLLALSGKRGATNFV